MTVATSEPFSISIVPPEEGMPSWHPAWVAPGVIVEIPSSGSIMGGGSWTDSRFDSAVDARLGTSEDWTPPNDVVSGGTRWPHNMWGYSGGTVAHVAGQPYLLIFGGGHRNGPDNTIYAFGPLHGPGSDAPTWQPLSPRTVEADLRTCAPHNADGRPTARHTSGDFSYGAGKLCMLWRNSVHCENGGVSHGVDVYDIGAGEWDRARSIPHDDRGEFRKIKQHGNSLYVPSKNLFYSITGGGGRPIGAYNPTSVTVDGVPPRSWREGPGLTGGGVGGDSMCCIMGDERGGLPDVVFSFHRGPGSHTAPQKIDLNTGVCSPWATERYPTGSAQAVAYDSLQERLYALNSGITSTGNRGLDPGSRDVAWVDVHDPDGVWNHESLHGVAPVAQISAGTYGRWSYVRELRGFVLHNSADSPVYFYRTAA